VVVASVGTSASLLLAALTKARNQARRAVCASNLRQQGLATTMYIDDHDNRMPLSRWNHGARPGHLYGDSGNNIGPVRRLLIQYSGVEEDLRVWVCPEFSVHGGSVYSPPLDRSLRKLVARGGGYGPTVPGGDEEWDPTTSSWVPILKAHNNLGALGFGPPQDSWASLRVPWTWRLVNKQTWSAWYVVCHTNNMSAVTNPSTATMFTEIMSDWQYDSYGHPPGVRWGEFGGNVRHANGDIVGQGGNSLLGDGHVEWGTRRVHLHWPQAAMFYTMP
jgi:hypothetical protein